MNGNGNYLMGMGALNAFPMIPGHLLVWSIAPSYLQYRCPRYWFLLRKLPQHCTDAQCFSEGRTTRNIAPSRRGISIPSDTWFLGPTRVYPPIGVLIGSAVFARSRTTDRLRYSVCSNRPHLAVAAMRPNITHNLNVTVLVYVLFVNKYSLPI